MKITLPPADHPVWPLANKIWNWCVGVGLPLGVLIGYLALRYNQWDERDNETTFATLISLILGQLAQRKTES